MEPIKQAKSNPMARPFSTLRFAVEIQIDDVSEQVCNAAFSEVDGLELSIETKTLREGGNNNMGKISLFGPVETGSLILRRGMTPNFDLWHWFSRVTTPGYRGIRPTAEVVMLTPDGTEETARFILRGVLPTRIKAPALSAAEGQVGIEEMQLSYQHISLGAPNQDRLSSRGAS